MTQRGVIQSVWWGSVCRSVGYGLGICGGGGGCVVVVVVVVVDFEYMAIVGCCIYPRTPRIPQ